MNALRRGSGAARAASRGSGATAAAAVLGRSQVVRMSSTSSAAAGKKEHKVRWPLSITREVNWGELDSFNHVNNVVHFRTSLLSPPFLPFLIATVGFALFSSFSRHISLLSLRYLRVWAGWFETLRCEQALKLGAVQPSCLIRQK
jgi:hypothetical protein